MKNKRKVREDIEYLKPIDPATFGRHINIFKGSLAECIGDISANYGFNRECLLEEAYCDEYGGFDEGFPVGSITRSEGKIMYGLIRCFQFTRVLEIGTLYGCSTNHLASAVKMNSAQGQVTSIDNGADAKKVGSLISPELKHNVVLITGDLYEELPKIPDQNIEFIFEDSAHREETTQFCLEQARRILIPGGWIVLHDTLCSTHVKRVPCKTRMLEGIRRAGLKREMRHYVVDNSTYGIGIYRNG